MSKNFFPLKTGHASSDAYFKKQPIWFDSDMLHAFIIGVGHGALIATLLIFLI